MNDNRPSPLEVALHAVGCEPDAYELTDAQFSSTVEILRLWLQANDGLPGEKARG